MMIEMFPMGPPKELNLLEVVLAAEPELVFVLKTRKLLPSSTEVSTITFFIVVSLTVRIQNAVLVFFISRVDLFNDGFTIVRI